MGRDSKTKRRRKRARREKNRREREAVLAERGTAATCARGLFRAKARAGDEAELRVEFGETEVPYDPEAEDPGEDVRRRQEAVQTWDEAGNPTSGEG